MAGGPIERKGRNERASASPPNVFLIKENKTFGDLLLSTINSCHGVMFIQLHGLERKKQHMLQELVTFQN